MERLRRLQPKHVAAARMRVEGISNAEVAERLHVKVQTLYEWYSDDLIKAEIARQMQNIDEVFAVRMAELAAVGVTELIRTAQLPLDVESLSPGQKLEFLREALDRVPQTAKVGAGNGGGNINNYVLPADMPVESLIARGRQLLIRAGSVDADADTAAD